MLIADQKQSVAIDNPYFLALVHTNTFLPDDSPTRTKQWSRCRGSWEERVKTIVGTGIVYASKRFHLLSHELNVADCVFPKFRCGYNLCSLCLQIDVQKFGFLV